MSARLVRLTADPVGFTASGLPRSAYAVDQHRPPPARQLKCSLFGHCGRFEVWLPRQRCAHRTRRPQPEQSVSSVAATRKARHALAHSDAAEPAITRQALAQPRGLGNVASGL
jgi:hypothetical protein